MSNALILNSKRELLAQGLFWSGAALLVSGFGERDSLVVLNYHRIGNPDEDLFDSDVYSATAEQFDDQISLLKRGGYLVSLDEALAFIGGTIKERTRRCRVLITLDDGYLDNYTVAFPVLRSNSVEAVFFLATDMVGSCQVPWWDHITYIVKTARKRQFSLSFPFILTVDIDKDGLATTLRAILKHYKSPRNSDSARFIRELEEAADGEEVPKTARRFLNWQEAREMIQAGMIIGSHTHSHAVLSHLAPTQQLEELVESRSILKKHLGIDANVLAYPVGGRDSFTEQTKAASQEAGYQAAFSFYGGTNLPGKTPAYDVRRVFVGPESLRRFHVQTKFCRHLSRFWP